MQFSTPLRLIILYCLLTSVSLLAQTPVVNYQLPAEVLTGEQFCFDVEFSNQSAPGYRPYLRLIVPPGVAFDGASFAGAGALTRNLGVISGTPPNNFIVDPIALTNCVRSALDRISGPQGSTVILVEYPVYSLPAGGASLATQICLTPDNTVSADTPFDVCLQGVYAYGASNQNDAGPIGGASVCNSSTPRRVTFSHSIDNQTTDVQLTPGGGAANCHAKVNRLSLEVDPTSPLDGPFTLTQNLPTNVRYLGNISLPAGCTASEPTVGSSGGTLTVTCTGSYTGTAAAEDVLVTFDVAAADVLDETICDLSQGTSTATFTKMGMPAVNQSVDVDVEHVKLLHTNNVGSAVLPGQTISYTINFDITEFTSGLNSGEITFTVPDGMTYNPASLAFAGVAVNPVNVTVIPIGTGTRVTVDVSAQNGAPILPCNSPELRYTADVGQTYSNGDPVLADDVLTHTSTLTYSLQEGATGCSLSTSSTVELTSYTISKTVINSPPSGPNRNGQWWPGDDVEYELTIQIPSNDADNVVITDFLPRPIHDVRDLAASFGTDVDFAPSSCWTIPPVNYQRNAATNALIMDFGDVSDAFTGGCVDIVLRVTIPITGVAADNGFFHSNILRAEIDNSDGNTNTMSALATLQVAQPELTLDKTITGSDNPNAVITPNSATEDSNITGLMAGDEVSFSLIVRNTGGAPGSNAVITDRLPTELTNCTLAPTPVTDANNNAVSFTGGFVVKDLTIAITAPDNDFSLDRRETFEYLVSYTCEVGATVLDGESFFNTAEVTWSSADGNNTFAGVKDTARLFTGASTSAPEVMLSGSISSCVGRGPLAFVAIPAPTAGATGVFTTTAAGGLSDNGDGTATLDPNAAGAGTFDVTYTYTVTSSGATDAETIQATINPGPVLTLNDPADVCASGNDLVFTATPPPGPGTTGTFTTTATAGLTDNGDGTADLDVSAAGPGTYDVTYTYSHADGCSNTTTVSVTVSEPPVVEAGVTVENCTKCPFILSKLGASITPTSLSGNWIIIEGDGSFDNPSGDFATTNTYTPGQGDTDRGTFTLRLVSNDPTGLCSPVQDDVTVRLKPVSAGNLFWDGN